MPCLNTQGMGKLVVTNNLQCMEQDPTFAVIAGTFYNKVSTQCALKSVVTICSMPLTKQH